MAKPMPKVSRHAGQMRPRRSSAKPPHRIRQPEARSTHRLAAGMHVAVGSALGRHTGGNSASDGSAPDDQAPADAVDQ